MAHLVLRIHITSEFRKSFRKLPPDLQELAIKKDRWFRQNAFDPRLRTHKLKGELQGFWSYRVNQNYRALFRFLEGQEVIYYDIGTHEIYH